MYKVLIVDDEPTIREGLAGLIPWEDYKITQVETAENGEVAIQKHQQISPDLMIVDIKMPGMNGIELIERIREVDSKTHFIILSGYADFNYARNAIHFGVESYLLKPIVEEELMELLARLKETWEQEIEINNRIEEEYKEKMAENILKGHPIDTETDNFFQNLGWTRYRLLLIHFDDHDSLTSNKLKIVNNLKQKYQLIAQATQSSLTLILKDKPTIHWKGVYDVLNRSVVLASHSCVIALSDPVAATDQIANAYQRTLKLLRRKFFYEQGQVLTPDTVPIYPFGEIENGNESSWQMQAEKLLYVIELGEQKDILDICQEIAARWVEEKPSEEWIKKNFIQLVSLMVNKFSARISHDAFSALMEKVIDIERQPTIRQLINHISDILSNLLENKQKQNPDVIVKKMVYLIEQQYNSNLKLDTLADTLHYHRGYLGKLFKEYTGDYFNTYLDKVRIEKSKHLLLQELKIYEVAEKVGYSNVDYFHSKFKKYTGMSPSHFRKQKVVKK